MTRHLSDGLTRRLGQAFVVLNRPGANTNLATLAVIRSKPDGYTLLIASFGLAANPSLYKRLGFEPQTDLDPIVLIANSPTILVALASLPVQLARRVHRLRAGAAGRAQLRLLRRRQQPASRRRAVPEHDRHEDGARALWRRRAGRGRRDDQPGAVAFSSVVPVLGMLRGGTLKAIAIAADRRSELIPTRRPSRSRGRTARPAPGTADSARQAAAGDHRDLLHRASVARWRIRRSRRMAEQAAGWW